VKSHLLRIFKDKKSMAVVWLIILMPCIDVIALKLQWRAKFHPAIAFFLAGTSEGHMMQILLYWFLPIHLLILCAESYIQDVKSGSHTIWISSMGKRAYFGNKLAVSFLVPFAVMLFALLLNLLLVSIVYAGGTESNGLFDMDGNHDPLFLFSQAHPILVDILFMLNVCLFTGLVGMFAMSISFVFPDRKYAYPLAFFIWFILLALPTRSVIKLMQPFTEYGIDFMIPAFLTNFTILTIIPIALYIYKVKTDEL
jgi:hypothetical protein